MMATIRYRGVSWDDEMGRWHADIVIEGHHMHLGYFVTDLEAAHAYNEMAVQYFGDLAILNTVGGEVI